MSMNLRTNLFQWPEGLLTQKWKQLSSKCKREYRNYTGKERKKQKKRKKMQKDIKK